jgi:hypothetical protein
MDWQVRDRAAGEFEFQESTTGYTMPCVSVAPIVVQFLTDKSKNQGGLRHGSIESAAFGRKD